MTIVNAIYKNGAFQPTEKVELPDDCHVRLSIEPVDPGPNGAQAIQEIYRLMSRRFHSGERDLAERHNEHQP